jgi:hypothetical protein
MKFDTTSHAGREARQFTLFESRSALPFAARLAIGFLMLLFTCSLSVGPSIAQDAGYWSPWVTNLTITSATVNWKGTETAAGSVEYATSSYYDAHQAFDKTATSSTTGTYQHVLLTDLEPNTSYVYRARPSDNADAFANRTFKTMPVSGPFTFLVISDTHAQEGRFKYVADAIAANETDALFILDSGDFASWDHVPYWQNYFQDGDGVFAKFPLVHVIGNHEYHNLASPIGPPTAAVQYHSAYDVPDGGALNYSFDCSGVRFIALNSPDPDKCNGDDPQTSLTLAKSQAPWLAQQLDNDLAGTFTVHHHPIWDYGRTGINPNLQPWESLYQTYNISASFVGHTHNYQRYSVHGIPYFVLGNAGGRFNNMHKDSPRAKWYQYGQTRQLGYLKVAVDPENNTATAQEIFVAYVDTDEGSTATAYDTPIVADTVTFPLSSVVSVTKSGVGSGTVTSSDSSINCGSTCRATYRRTPKLTFTVTPDAGSVFNGWTGACSGNGKCVVNVRPRAETTVGAIFVKDSCTYTISPRRRTVPSQGSDLTIGITAKGYAYCRAPEIVNNTDWVTQDAAVFSNNRGSVRLSIPLNQSPTARTGTLTIGGATLTLTQNGAH